MAGPMANFHKTQARTAEPGTLSPLIYAGVPYSSQNIEGTDHDSLPEAELLLLLLQGGQPAVEICPTTMDTTCRWKTGATNTTRGIYQGTRVGTLPR